MITYTQYEDRRADLTIRNVTYTLNMADITDIFVQLVDILDKQAEVPEQCVIEIKNRMVELYDYDLIELYRNVTDDIRRHAVFEEPILLGSTAVH